MSQIFVPNEVVTKVIMLIYIDCHWHSAWYSCKGAENATREKSNA